MDQSMDELKTCRIMGNFFNSAYQTVLSQEYFSFVIEKIF